MAAAKGHKNVVELLIAFKADVNTKDDGGRTPAHWAARYGHDDVANLLCEQEAKHFAETDPSQTPPPPCQANTHPAATEIRPLPLSPPPLLAKATVSTTLTPQTIEQSQTTDTEIKDPIFLAMWSAIETKDTSTVETSLKSGANPNARELAGSSKGLSPLHCLAYVMGPEDDPGIVLRDQLAELLILNGADVNLRALTNTESSAGFTALHIAANRGRVRFTEILLTAGADRSLRSLDSGESALDLALQSWNSFLNTHVSNNRKLISKLLRDENTEGASVKSPNSCSTLRVAKTGDQYVDSCFDFTFARESDARNWKEMSGLANVPRLVTDGEYGKAEQAITVALAAFPDFYFPHYWKGVALKRQGRIEDARAAYLAGIQASMDKLDLCVNLAYLELEHGNLRDAVCHWVRAALLQFLRDEISDPNVFLFLMYTAITCGEHDTAQHLHPFCKMHGSSVDLGNSTKAILQSKLSSLRDPSIAKAIVYLNRFLERSA